MTKSPVPLVTAGADLVPRASLTSTTVAPGMTPPCGSLIVPDTVPVVIWPHAGTPAASNMNVAVINVAVINDTLVFVIIYVPPIRASLQNTCLHINPRGRPECETDEDCRMGVWNRFLAESLRPGRS